MVEAWQSTLKCSNSMLNTLHRDSREGQIKNNLGGITGTNGCMTQDLIRVGTKPWMG